jgi:hypothetical protein
VLVAGVVSSSCDCTIVVQSYEIRMLTPLTAGSEALKLSKYVPNGWRSSR